MRSLLETLELVRTDGAGAGAGAGATGEAAASGDAAVGAAGEDPGAESGCGGRGSVLRFFLFGEGSLVLATPALIEEECLVRLAIG